MGDLVNLNPGDKIYSWTIVDKLGEGGFGAVYKVSKKNKYYAMKTESSKINNKVLKMEVYVMRKANERKSKHFCICEDTGEFNKVLYVVMTMVGPSLDDHRRSCPGQKFSIGCALSVGVQCVNGIEELHAIGFLHRDVKPSNFASGHKDSNELSVIYMLDFGMARQYLDDNNQIRAPRKRTHFKGTVRYVPLSIHVRREYSRKDDLESWLYQQIEITRSALPWRSDENQDRVAMYKERCRFDDGLRELMGGCPREYIEILRHIDILRYYDEPDYKKSAASLKMQEFQWVHQIFHMTGS